MLFSERAQFDLARRLRLKAVPIGEVFSFLSGLYFRGKMAYVREFARPPAGLVGGYVITTNRGLISVETPMKLEELRKFSEVDIDPNDERYHLPLIRTAKRIAGRLPAQSEVVLLGSIATGKYVDVLLKVFEERLVFPEEFVGRGDMSRGGLMLRSAADRLELKYTPVRGAVRQGKRPEKLSPRRYPADF